ncbi:MAG TPA: hypothetical protein VHV81_02455 [Steroidobacteraceae bacterium]|jgi:hypothetical protein|nr:hypothetical protein [Steroidobacteraceae bacterium]
MGGSATSRSTWLGHRGAAPSPASSLALERFQLPELRQEFDAQGSFVARQEFLPPAVTTALIGAAETLAPAIHRNYLPGHKQGGSISRHVIDRHAPAIAELYRSPALIDWLSAIAGEPLQLSPRDDPHAYALYYYTRAGDHIGWHYDTSYYRGRRYTLLLGVIDESACRLDYELHTRERGAAVIRGSTQIAPGGFVFFDGDKLRHRISPLEEGGRRVSLTFEYVTDPAMHPWRRVISNFKDAVAYFGLSQVFGKPG